MTGSSSARVSRKTLRWLGLSAALLVGVALVIGVLWWVGLAGLSLMQPEPTVAILSVAPSSTAVFPNPIPRAYAMIPTRTPTITMSPTADAAAIGDADDIGIITPTPAVPPQFVGPLVTVTHIIQPGETLGQIAAAYAASPAEIIAANEIANPNILVVGQPLTIPGVRATWMPPQMPTGTPTSTPLPPPLPDTLNEIPLASLVVMPEGVREHIREIYARGQLFGNDPRAFSKLGDSTIEPPFFMAEFASAGLYDLGAYGRLQDVIDYFAGSFDRQSLAVQRGMNSWAVFDPVRADSERCQLMDGPLACEFRVHRPSVVFIRLGTNDLGTKNFADNLGRIVQFCIDNGVIPLLGTKADRFRDPDNNVNDIIRRVAASYHVPLWDYDLAAESLPDRGLTDDGIHMTTFYAHNYTWETAFDRGYAVHNLLALLALDAVWKETTPPAEQTAHTDVSE